MDIKRHIEKGAAILAVAALSISTVIGIAPKTAWASEADIIAQMDAGNAMIDTSSIYYGTDRATWREEWPYFLRNIRGINPCLSYSMQSFVGQKTKNVDSIRVVYDVDNAQVPARTAAYWNEVRRIAGEARGTSYERAKYVYQALMSRCSYNWDAAGRGNANDPVYIKNCTPASALLDGHTICAGYARACVDLFREIGLEAWTFPVVLPRGRHLLVGVNIDGLYCTCDPTNDDSSGNLNKFMVLLDGNNYRGEKSAVDVNANAAAPVGSSAVSTAATTGITVVDAAPAPEPEPEPVYETVIEYEPQWTIEEKEVTAPLIPYRKSVAALYSSNDTIYSILAKGKIDKGYTVGEAFKLYQRERVELPPKEIVKTVRVA